MELFEIVNKKYLLYNTFSIISTRSGISSINKLINNINKWKKLIDVLNYIRKVGLEILYSIDQLNKITDKYNF